MAATPDHFQPRRAALLALAVAAALAFACGEDPGNQPAADAGFTEDAGLASDAGQAPADAAIELDAGTAADAGNQSDAGTRPDAGGPRDAGSYDAGGGGERVLVRMLAGNLTTGADQTYDQGEGIRIFQGLQPDLALIQEFNYGDNGAAALREFVDTAFGPDFEFFRESQAADRIPNGIVSRYPILQAGEWEYTDDRDLVWARIDLPGPGDLWAVSVHLLTASPSERTAGARTAIDRLKQLMAPGDLLAFGGDFNTATRTEYCLTVLSELFDTAAPYPADQAGNTNTSAPRTKPLDWLLASPALEAYEVPVQIGDNSFPNGLVFDSRVYQPLYDVEPVEQEDCDALNMQHMAVVRDFELPE